MRKLLATMFLAALVVSIPTRNAGAIHPSSILPPASLNIKLDDLDKITFYFSESSFDSHQDAAELQSNGGHLIGNKKSIPLATAKSLLGSLKDMYPSPEAVTLLHWTDDYPYEQVTIKLKDGRQIVAISSSQFPKGVPWNIRVWQGDPNKSGELIGSYVLLNYDFHAGASKIWEALTGEAFPRNYGFDQFYWSEDEKKSTIEFYVPRPNDGFQSYGNEISVQGKEPDAVLTPFVPALKRNVELSQLFEKGYTLFDAAFNITVEVNTLSPVSYSGMIALKAPHSPDVIVSTASITDTNQADVQTPLTINAVEQEIAKRKNFSHLQDLTDFIPGIVYIHDLRNTKPGDFVDLECDQNQQYAKYDYHVQALLTNNSDQKIDFYHLPQEKAWTLDGGFSRESGTWSDEIVNTALQKWFPASFSVFLPRDIQLLSANVAIAFRPGVTEQKPELISILKHAFPSQSKLHIAHPQKVGDKTFAHLEGRLIIPEDKANPQIVYCGHPRPDWYGPAYKVNEVKSPDPSASRFDLQSEYSAKDNWTPLFDLPDKSTEVDDTTFTTSKSGYIHMLWTINKKGVFYSEGWADGTGWLKPQRLGDDSWYLQAVSNSQGEVHLFWSTFDPSGTMHVWRNSRGEWQKPEYWEGIGYFSNILFGDDGKLHLTWSESDGWDEEFFYAEWTKEGGVSEPENVSRRQGDIGNTSIILRLDSRQQIRAVWGHPLSGQQYIDPLSGEAFDTTGLFYSERLGKDDWTLPEQIGTFAPFTGAMGFELTDDDNPVVVWQALDGIVSSTRIDDRWSSPKLLHKVVPPEEPDPFGPGRWVEATAQIALQKDASNQLHLEWIDAGQGLYLSVYEDQTWLQPEQILSDKGLSNLSALIGTDNSINLLYFDSSGQLYHLKYSNGESQKTPLSIAYDEYGLESAKMEIDKAGFIYVLGLPRTPHWKAYIPPAALSLIPTPLPTVTPSPIPSKTPAVTITPNLTKAPVTTPTSAHFIGQSNVDTFSTNVFIVSLSATGLVLLLWALRRKKV